MRHIIGPVFVALVAVAVVSAQQWDQVNGGMFVQSRTTGALVRINQQGTGNILQLDDNGTTVWSVADGGASSFTPQLRGPVGCENGAVPYSFTGDTDTGLCRPEPNELELVINAFPMINIQDQATSRPAFFLQQDVTAFGANLEVLAMVGTGTGPWVIGTNANGSGDILGVTLRGNVNTATGWTFQPDNDLVPETDGGVSIGQVSGSVLRPAHIFLAGGVFSSTVQTTGTATDTDIQILASPATNDDPTEALRQYRVATTDATVTTIATIAIPATTTVGLNCTVVNRRTGGASGTAEDGAYYEIKVAMKNVAGTATEIAAETVTVIGESQAAWTVSAAPSGGNELIQVTGAAGNNITWHATCRRFPIGS